MNDLTFDFFSALTEIDSTDEEGGAALQYFSAGAIKSAI